jgi:hypothetical protein
VLDAFCYGKAWARDLSRSAKQRVLEVLRDLYASATIVPDNIEIVWVLSPQHRFAGPAFEYEDEQVEMAVSAATEQLMFGDNSERVISMLCAAAVADDS